MIYSLRILHLNVTEHPRISLGYANRILSSANQKLTSLDMINNKHDWSPNKCLDLFESAWKCPKLEVFELHSAPSASGSPGPVNFGDQVENDVDVVENIDPDSELMAQDQASFWRHMDRLCLSFVHFMSLGSTPATPTSC